MMGKKNLTKSEKQIQILEEYYQHSQGNWPREGLEQMAEDLGLTRQQVYKWLWDKKVQDLKKKEQQSNLVKKERLEVAAKQHTFEYRQGFGKITVPSRMRQAIQFTIRPNVSAWTISILKQKGWQFVQENLSSCSKSDSFEENSEKESMKIQDRLPPVMPFFKEEVKKEVNCEMKMFEFNPPPKVENFVEMMEAEEDDYPFLKKKIDFEVEEDSCRSVKRYMFGQERQNCEEKLGNKLINLRKETGPILKDSSEEIFESK